MGLKEHIKGPRARGVQEVVRGGDHSDIVAQEDQRGSEMRQEVPREMVGGSENTGTWY